MPEENIGEQPKEEGTKEEDGQIKDNSVEDNQEEKKLQEEDQSTKISKKSDGLNVMAILSYFWILFLVPLFNAKDDEFAQFHAKQGMVLFSLWVVSFVIGMIPLVGWLVTLFINIAIAILSLIGIINVIKKEKKQLPIIGKYADQLADNLNI